MYDSLARHSKNRDWMGNTKMHDIVVFHPHDRLRTVRSFLIENRRGGKNCNYEGMYQKGLSSEQKKWLDIATPLKIWNVKAV